MGRGDSRKTKKILRRRRQTKLQERIVRRQTQVIAAKKAAKPVVSAPLATEAAPATKTRRKKAVAS